MNFSKNLKGLKFMKNAEDNEKKKDENANRLLFSKVHWNSDRKDGDKSNVV